MSDPFIDTDVIIRLLTGDDPQKQDEAEPDQGYAREVQASLEAKSRN